MNDKPANLKETGLKVTMPRIKILELFQNTTVRHLSAEDIYRQLSGQKIDVGLATVYRVLTQFEQAGLLTRNYFEPTKAIYELNEGEHHDHIVCVDCGWVEEFHDDQIEERQREIARERGVEIVDHSLALYCRCKNCLNKAAT